MKTSTCKLARTLIKKHIDDLEEDVSEVIADKNASKVSEHISQLTIGGKFSQTGMWKLKNTLCPKISEKQTVI